MVEGIYGATSQEAVCISLLLTKLFDLFRFACLACSDTFGTQLELEAHAHTHGSKAPYVCGLCGKLFAEQRYFRQHMKRHTARAIKQKMHGQLPVTPPGPAG